MQITKGDITQQHTDNVMMSSDTLWFYM